MNGKYFKVVAKCGHVGRGKCIYVAFATIAENARAAAQKARYYKRVKHDHKDAIQSVMEISFEEFICLRSENDNDPYLHCKNVQEQRKIPDFERRIVDDPVEQPKRKKSHSQHRWKIMRALAQEAESTLQTFIRIGECL